MKRLGVFVGAACVLSLAACSMMEKKTESTGPVVSGTVAENTVTVTATVEKIDLAKRLVTLRGPQGNSVTFKVGDAVKNLPQVKVGDEVVATYYESLAYQVKKPGEAAPGVTTAEGAGAAKPGEMPAGFGASVVTVTSTIEAIDKKAPSVTLKDPDGQSVTVKVKDPSKLDKVKVGDLVEITYSQAVAISVEKAQK